VAIRITFEDEVRVFAGVAVLSAPATRIASNAACNSSRYPRLLILDELGYLPLAREEASLFFRLIVRPTSAAA
jgi:hypothetical protein